MSRCDWREHDGYPLRKCIEDRRPSDSARSGARKSGKIIIDEYPCEHIPHRKCRAQKKTVRIKRERSPRRMCCDCTIIHTALETFGRPSGKSFKARVQGKERKKRDERVSDPHIPIGVQLPSRKRDGKCHVEKRHHDAPRDRVRKNISPRVRMERAPRGDRYCKQDEKTDDARG